jgi:hypothetical protein
MFDAHQRAIVDVVGDVLSVDVSQSRPDTPLRSFGLEPQDWIVLAAALDEAFPDSAPHLHDDDLDRCATVGDLVDRVRGASGHAPGQEGTA